MARLVAGSGRLMLGRRNDLIHVVVDVLCGNSDAGRCQQDDQDDRKSAEDGRLMQDQSQARPDDSHDQPIPFAR